MQNKEKEQAFFLLFNQKRNDYENEVEKMYRKR